MNKEQDIIQSLHEVTSKLEVIFKDSLVPTSKNDKSYGRKLIRNSIDHLNGAIKNITDGIQAIRAFNEVSLGCDNRRDELEDIISDIALITAPLEVIRDLMYEWFHLLMVNLSHHRT